MPQGYLSLVLHAHLPYVRHPEHPRFLEELWLFEAITETYLPLLRVLERLEDDGVDYRLVLSLSPPLVAMLEDEVLSDRYLRHLHQLCELSEREVVRTSAEPQFNQLARWYVDELRDVRYWYEERCGRRLIPAFRNLAARGRLELMTCAGTHGLLPLLKVNPGAVRCQVHTAAEYHRQVFGAPARGMWVPECAYYPGLDEVLAAAGVRYFFVDTHGLANATAAPKRGEFAPLYTPAGVAAFARDKETSYQVWAAECGYPGHADYREFYRDIGFDLPEEELRDFLIDGRIRVNTGIKYYRITKRGNDKKEPYNPRKARERAAEHAGNFVFNRQTQIRHLAGRLDRPPLVVAPYDAELFGHWWFEGPRFLDYVLRKLCYDQTEVKALTPGEYLERFPANQDAVPAGSSWGGDGTYDFWLNATNDSIYRDLHRAADRLTELVDRQEWSRESREYRALQQMTRELMLAQASDWPFIMRTGTSPEYALKRVRDHLARFHNLEEMFARQEIVPETLQALEFVDRIFPDVRPEWYSRRPERWPQTQAEVAGRPAGA